MQAAGKISATIEVLTDFLTRRVPLKICLKDWARNARYAGAKDRAWISGLALDALRHRALLDAQMNDDSARALVLGTLALVWKMPVEDIERELTQAPHGAGGLSAKERSNLTSADGGEQTKALWQEGNFPEWMEPAINRVFEDPLAEMRAFARRAPVDLRINSLKTTIEKAQKACKNVDALPAPWVKNGLRIAAPPVTEKPKAVETIPAFSKGWVEVQDLGSQICALVAGDIKGKQVLDFCAGGGGKTIALSALMENSGQIHSYDIDARRLAPLFHRAKRAGVRNCQIHSPQDQTLDDLKGKMDLVFVDAPCTGTGTWRRRPDTKWRLTEKQLQTRMRDQDKVLMAASQYVRPGGALVYVTCSFLREENEDRLAAFLKEHIQWDYGDVPARLAETGLLTDEAMAMLARCGTAQGGLRLTPLQSDSDGFFVQALQKQAL